MAKFSKKSCLDTLGKCFSLVEALKSATIDAETAFGFYRLIAYYTLLISRSFCWLNPDLNKVHELIIKLYNELNNKYIKVG